MRTRMGEDIGAGTVDGLVAERMSEGKATTVEREWVVVVVKEQGEERWENAELSHFASGRSAATKIKGRSSPKQRKALSEVYRSLRYPYKTPACRAIVQQFAAWLHYFGASTAKHVKRWRPTFAFFRLATTHAESSIRGGNFVWKRNVQPNFLFPPDHLLDSRTLPMSQLSEQNSKSYLIRQYLQRFALPPRRSCWRLQRNWRFATLWICKLFPGVWLCI